MLTPVFEIKQEENFLVLEIKAPFAKVTETEIFIEENEFKFYSKPYYLRLTLPGNITENGKETANYEAEKGVFHIRVPKEKPGEHFEGLDMLTKLLAPKGLKTAATPLIEVISEHSNQENSNHAVEINEFDWQIEQKVQKEETTPLLCPKYGFGNQRSGVLKKLQAELVDIVDVKNPDDITPHERHLKRLEQENEKFDEDHYLADLYEDEVIQDIMKYKPPWMKDKTSNTFKFSDEEKEKMLKLPRKEYLLDERSLQMVYFGLVDILFAYAYDYRTTYGETNVESCWTICKLSSSLSWLEGFTSLKDVLIASFRRCLCFPLYRHWGLCKEVLKDIIKIFSSGRNQVLKCLLAIHTTLSVGDPYYIINDLYVTDYCIWIQSISDKKLLSLSESLQKLSVSKDDIGFELTELENAAKLVIDDEKEVAMSHNEETYTLKSVIQNMSDMHINKGISQSRHSSLDSDDDSSLSDNSSTESSCSDEETTESDDEISETEQKTSHPHVDVSEKSGVSDNVKLLMDHSTCDSLSNSCVTSNITVLETQPID